MTPSESLVHKICQKSFLSLWSFANPLQSNQEKELCDVLVVFDNNVVVFSVKEIEYKATTPEEVGQDRWAKRAIESSVKQILGAEKELSRLPEVIDSTGNRHVKVPHSRERKVFRIAVALGSNGNVNIPSGDFEGRFVHVFDENALFNVMQELDTIADFTEYLRAKEEFSGRIAILGSEADLLAFYIQEGKKFPVGVDQILIDKGMWEQLATSSRFQARKQKDRVSYAWDKLLVDFIAYFRGNELLNPMPPEQFEIVVRYMAAEDRFGRRFLSDAFLGLMNKAEKSRSKGETHSRTTTSHLKVTYVFVVFPRTLTREQRRAYLEARCFVARGEFKDNPVVIGLGTERPQQGEGQSFDFGLLKEVNLDGAFWAEHARLKDSWKFYEKPERVIKHYEEYPMATNSSPMASLAPLAPPTRIGPNAKCPCGSSKKYKKCCGRFWL